MENKVIDINVDVGEGMGNEEVLMPFISSCNIACGGHAGDLNTMKLVVKLAKKNQVKMGAHPSFPDKENFGRLAMAISSEDLMVSLKEQIKVLMSILDAEGQELHHVKPHGALYNLAAESQIYASVIIEVMKSLPQPVKLYAPYNSVIAALAVQEQIPVVFEAFADRNYNENLSLVSRTNPKALIQDPDVMSAHVLEMVLNKQVKTISGKWVPIQAETFCIHGDTENAVQLIKSLRDRLEENHIRIH